MAEAARSIPTKKPAQTNNAKCWGMRESIRCNLATAEFECACEMRKLREGGSLIKGTHRELEYGQRVYMEGEGRCNKKSIDHRRGVQ